MALVEKVSRKALRERMADLKCINVAYKRKRPSHLWLSPWSTDPLKIWPPRQQIFWATPKKVAEGKKRFALLGHPFIQQGRLEGRIRSGMFPWLCNAGTGIGFLLTVSWSSDFEMTEGVCLKGWEDKKTGWRDIICLKEKRTLSPWSYSKHNESTSCSYTELHV